MNKLAYASIFIAGVALFFLTEDDNIFAGVMSGIMWAVSIIGLIKGD